MIRVDYTFGGAHGLRLTQAWDAAEAGRVVCSSPTVDDGALSLCGTCPPCQYWLQGYGRA